MGKFKGQADLVSASAGIQGLVGTFSGHPKFVTKLTLGVPVYEANSQDCFFAVLPTSWRSPGKT